MLWLPSWNHANVNCILKHSENRQRGLALAFRQGAPSQRVGSIVLVEPPTAPQPFLPSNPEVSLVFARG